MTARITGELKTQLETDGFIVLKGAYAQHPALQAVKAEIERISHYIAPDFDPVSYTHLTLPTIYSV